MGHAVLLVKGEPPKGVAWTWHLEVGHVGVYLYVLIGILIRGCHYYTLSYYI